MRNHRIRRAQGLQAAAPAGSRAPRVPRLRLGRDRRCARTTGSTTSAPSATSSQLKAAAALNGSDSTTGLGHTRWATHGRVSEENAHPLTGCEEGELALVLNGIVENYRELKESLSRRTDTRSAPRPTPRSSPT